MVNVRNKYFIELHANGEQYVYKKDENLFCVYSVNTMKEIYALSKFSAKDRKQNFFNKIEDAKDRHEIKSFFDAWITYLDEKEHTIAREIVIKFLKHNINNVLNKRIDEVIIALKEIFHSSKEVFGISDNIELATIKILAVVFDMKYEVMQEFIEHARYITEFAFNDNPSKEESEFVIKKMQSAKKFVKEEKSLDFLKSKIVKNDSQDGYALVVNAVITAFTPIKSSISSCIMELLSDKSLLNIENRILSRELIRFNSPFNYVARQNIEAFVYHGVQINKGTRFEFCLPSFNMDPEVFIIPSEINKLNSKPNYSFGIDSYFCPGAGVAKNVLDLLITIIKENANYEIVSYAVENIYTVHLLKDIVIKKIKSEVL